jgi:hypothetical protein
MQMTNLERIRNSFRNPFSRRFKKLFQNPFSRSQRKARAINAQKDNAPLIWVRESRTYVKNSFSLWKEKLRSSNAQENITTPEEAILPHEDSPVEIAYILVMGCIRIEVDHYLSLSLRQRIMRFKTK